VEIRLIAEGEESLCNDFQNRFHRKNRTIQQWRWEFLDNNYDQTPIPYAVTEDNGKIVATQALIPIRMIDRDGTYWTAKSEETLVDPDYRGRQLLGKMYALLLNYAEEHGFAYIWGFTGVEPAIKALSRLNFIVPVNIEQVLMPFSSRSIPIMMGKRQHGKNEGVIDKLKMAVIRSGCVLVQTVSSLKIALSRKRVIENIDIRTMEKPDERTGELCRRFIGKWGGTTIFRDADYVRWRLFDNPYVRSVVRALYDQNELLGWTAFTLGDDGMGYLVDLMVAGDDSRYATEDLVRILLLEAVVGTRNMGAVGLRGWRINNHPFDRIICRVAKKAGFYHIKRGNVVVLYDCEAGKKRPSYKKFDDWFVSRIYTEGVIG